MRKWRLRVALATLIATLLVAASFYWVHTGVKAAPPPIAPCKAATMTLYDTNDASQFSNRLGSWTYMTVSLYRMYDEDYKVWCAGMQTGASFEIDTAMPFDVCTIPSNGVTTTVRQYRNGGPTQAAGPTVKSCTATYYWGWVPRLPDASAGNFYGWANFNLDVNPVKTGTHSQ